MADEPVVSLVTLGWNSERAAEFEPFAAEGFVPGRVSLEHNHVFRVMTTSGEILAESAGRMKHDADGRTHLPVVGDWVAVRLDARGSRSQIRHVLRRATSFSRKVAGRITEEQVLAANIDTVFVVYGLGDGVKVRGIERYLVVARQSGAAPVVVLNKADLSHDVAADRSEAESVSAGVPVVAASTRTGLGLAALESFLRPGQTIALLGPSGAGKSTIVNHLVGTDVLKTGEVREWDARGRHTSVHRQLVVRAAGGMVIDTPGLRELQLWDAEGMNDTFADIVDFGAGCRFRDCRHDREPGCAVKAAVDAGAIDAGRYAGFLKLQREQEEMARKKEAREQDPSKRSVKIQQRALRALQKDRQKSGR